MTAQTADMPAPHRRVVQRQFDHQRIWRLASPVFEHAAEMIARAAPPADVILGIARGGVPLAELAARHLGLPAVALRAQHNLSDEIYLSASGEVRIAAEDIAAAASVVVGRRVLVADDICGSGATLKAVLRHVFAMQPATVHTVVLCRSAAAAFTPDLWVWSTRDWVVFPWNGPATEPTEPLQLPEQVQHGRAGSTAAGPAVSGESAGEP